jgi:hypothetical protein
MEAMPKLENSEEVRKFAREQATGIIEVLEKALLSEKVNDIQSCPNCSQEFALCEIEVEPKTLENAWSGALSRDRAIELIYDNIMAAVLTAKYSQPPVPPPPPANEEIARQIKALEPAITTLKEITQIMSVFRTAFNKAKNSQEIHNLLVNTLKDVDGALKNLNEE